MNNKQNGFKKSPIKPFLIFLSIIGLGLVIQSLHFFSEANGITLTTFRFSTSQTPLLPADPNNHRHNDGLFESSLPEEEKHEETKAVVGGPTMTSQESAKASAPKRTRNLARPLGATASRLFPKDWTVSVTHPVDLPNAVLKRLMAELDWPSDLSIYNFFPNKSSRKSFQGSDEIFLNFDIKIQGFWVPQSHLRVMLFTNDSLNYKISFVDHQFDLPPNEGVSLTVSKVEAIARVLSEENSSSELWQSSPEWHWSDEQWKATWKIQLMNSPHTHFIDVQTGEQEKELSEVGAQEASEALIRPKALPPTDIIHSVHRRKEILLQGMGTTEVGEPGDLRLFALPGMSVYSLESKKNLVADEEGILHTSQPLHTLSFSLNSSVVEVSDSKETELSFEMRRGSPRKVIFNPQKNSEQAAMINAFVYVTKANDFFLQNLGFKKNVVNKKVKTIVNSLVQICNAHYRNGVMTFYGESEECRNTAYDTSIYHEYAHFIDDLYGGIADIALSEGMGDVLATFLSSQPLVGQRLYKRSFAPMRSAENEAIYFEDPPNSEVSRDSLYKKSQAWSGFAWRAYQGLVDKYGINEGRRRAQILFLTPIETNAPNIPSAVAEVFARSSGGSDLEQNPDLLILLKAAQKHGLDYVITQSK